MSIDCIEIMIADDHSLMREGLKPVTGIGKWHKCGGSGGGWQESLKGSLKVGAGCSVIGYQYAENEWNRGIAKI